MKNLFRILLLLCLVISFGLRLGADDKAPKKTPPKLVVLVVFDQFRGDYLERWKNLYGDGGFKRLMTDGAWFANCHYPYSDTLTAPGHASLATGSTPSRHGIIANDWYDRAKGAMTASIEDDRFQLSPMPIKKTPGASPWRRREETIGDMLLKTHKMGRVASLSIKDRAAILLAALRAQICYWFSVDQGMFVTSTHYRDQPHAWVTQFNTTRPADRWVYHFWQQLLPNLDYAKFTGPDTGAQGVGYEQGSAFPHPFLAAKQKSDKDYYSAVTNSPMGSEMLLALAKSCIESEKLGQGDGPDLLCLSFSSNDLIGHCWGPDSPEVLDITLRSDRLVKDLLDFLDTTVGPREYVIAMAADHGVCPLPEVSIKLGKEASRIAPTTLKAAAADALQGAFAKDQPKLPWIEASYGPWIYLNRNTLKEAKVAQADAEKTVAAALAKVPGVLASFTRTQIQDTSLKDDKLLDSLRLSFHPDNSGDVMILPRPYHIVSDSLTSAKAAYYRTTHGTPHPYDTHVPLIVMGPGIQPGMRQERIVPQALASILADVLQVPAPPGGIAKVPDGLFVGSARALPSRGRTQRKSNPE